MKKIILAATAIVSAAALTTAARAADVPAPMAYDWSGFYFGANAGVAWNNSEVHNDLQYNGEGIFIDNTAPVADIEISPNEINDFLSNLGDDFEGDEAVFTGGALMGFNWQHDALVLGVEADINYADFSDEQSQSFNDLDLPILSDGPINAETDLSFDANWFGTLRGRIGFAADNFLIYGTGGLAYGHMEAEARVNVGDDSESAQYTASTDANNWGWTAGAGVEYGIDNWSLGVEYLYVDLGTAEWDADVKGNVSDEDVQDFLADIEGEGEVDYKFSVVRATVKYRF